MVLAGHRPEVIMEICTRAISFWTYQVLMTALSCLCSSNIRHIKSAYIKNFVTAKLMKRFNNWNLTISRYQQEEILRLLVSFSCYYYYLTSRMAQSVYVEIFIAYIHWLLIHNGIYS